MALSVHTVGSRVWVKHEAESWTKGEVAKVNDDGTVVVKTESGAEQTCKAEDAPLQNPESRGVEVSEL